LRGRICLCDYISDAIKELLKRVRNVILINAIFPFYKQTTPKLKIYISSESIRNIAAKFTKNPVCFWISYAILLLPDFGKDG
jgi:hypothetical protein